MYEHKKRDSGWILYPPPKKKDSTNYGKTLSTSSYTTNVIAEAGAALTAYATQPLKNPRAPSFRAIVVAQCQVPR